MKNLFITTIAISTALTFASAEESYGMPEKKMVRAMPAKMMATATPVMGMMEGAPRTGDAVIDGKIATLVKEREEKIRLIRQEYEVKIKAAIGDKKVLLKEMVGTSSRPVMKDGERPMMKDGERPMMNASGTKPMMRPEGAKDARPRPLGLFEGLFKSFFGGDAPQVQAEEAQ